MMIRCMVQSCLLTIQYALHVNIQTSTCMLLWASTKHFRHLERSYLLLLYGIGYNVIKWSHCELMRDLLCFCNDIILSHINANPMEKCF